MSRIVVGSRVLDDPPEGQCWKCPDCPSWATLPENAAYHMTGNRHGYPELVPIPDQPGGASRKIAVLQDALRAQMIVALRNGYTADELRAAIDEAVTAFEQEGKA